VRDVDPYTKASYTARLLDDATHPQAVAELAAGNVLAEAGYAVEYEPRLAGRLLGSSGIDVALCRAFWRAGSDVDAGGR
jgi:hypothetical protein